jgi:hypothetical protein
MGPTSTRECSIDMKERSPKHAVRTRRIQSSKAATIFQRGLSFAACGVIVLGSALTVGAAGKVDVSKLPAPSSQTIEFSRDIAPIFEKTCYRCHGPERPKSRFRLDTRPTALKGGENGVDIKPGQSADSPLIHYVAGLVEDMQMPPEGKGDPLTPQQIGLLRAWIDQGARYSETNVTVKTTFSVSPTLRWVTVSGNAALFREHNWRSSDWSGGIEEFSVEERINADTKFKTEGHAIFGDDDFAVKLSLDKDDVGFIHGGVEQFRKFSDDGGGYYGGFASPQYHSGKDLSLDVGRSWIDFGLTLPDWPRMVLGYEYQYREGTKSLLEWGDVTEGVVTKQIYPTFKEVSEKTHILKFDISHDIAGFHLENNFRGEFYDLDTRRYTPVGTVTGPLILGPRQITQEGESHFQAVNTFHLNKQVFDWLYASGGYFYSRLDGDANLQQQSLNAAGGMANGQFWNAPKIMLNQDSHIFNANVLLGPWADLTFSGGVQSQWTTQSQFGDPSLDIYFDPGFGIPPAYITNATILASTIGKFANEENFGTRYTGLPFTTLFADARFQQQQIGQQEEQIGGGYDFSRDTDAQGDTREYRAGFTVSPWNRVSLTADARHGERYWDYHHLRDESFGFINDGYSAFIRNRRTLSDEAGAKLTVRPTRWLRTTFGYKIFAIDSRTATDPYVDSFTGAVITTGSPNLSGNKDGEVFSLNAMITPAPRFYFSSTFAFERSRLETGQSVIAPYRGETFHVFNSARFALNPKTDLDASYLFSYADYGENNAINPLPLGIEYTRHGVQFGVSRRIKTNMMARLQYGFFWYNEPSSGELNDYTAHSILASFSMRLP